MAASMGLQQLKAWQDNKQKEVLTEKQMEMRKAMQQHEFDRARRLQAEAAKIAMEMENEAHIQRRKDIEKEYDNVFNSLIEQFQLEKWPLSVVPFIMKGESFGSHVRGFDVATVHCILTPSNNANFNRFVYNSIDLRVEQMMNINWNSNTVHQVVYYGGAWKPKAPNGVATLDYDDVVKLHAELKSVPVICITPYFLPAGTLIFRVWAWGMGADTTTRQDITPFAQDFSIPLNASSFIRPSDEQSEQEFTSKLNTFIVDSANYIIAMTGYLTDMYYWKMYNLPPLCLSLNLNFLPNNSLKKGLVDDYYDILNRSVGNGSDSNNTTKIDNVLSYYSKLEPHMDKVRGSKLIDKAYATFITAKGVNPENVEDLTFVLEDDDVSALEKFSAISKKYQFLDSIVEDIKCRIACNTISSTSDITIPELLEMGYNLLNGSKISSKIQFSIGHNGTFIALLDSDNKPINNRANPQCLYVEYENLIPNDRIRIQNDSFILSINKLEEILTKLSTR
jgi:hypothetical protein